MTALVWDMYNIEFGWDVVVGLDGVVRKWCGSGAEVVVFHGRLMHGCV